MLRMRIDAELTLRVQIGDSHSWACVGMADLTLKPETAPRIRCECSPSSNATAIWVTVRLT